MKSRAHIKSHPIHPILVSFPIAFFIGTLVFDALALLQDNTALWQTGTYLNRAGIITAVLAAVAGVIDYIYTVPPKSTAKTRATKHALLNSTNLIIFVTVYILRQDVDTSRLLLVGLELIGIVLMSIAGWMGGTLVHRNQVGVDIRYAQAGKWKELYTSETSGKIEVADANELKIDQMKLLHVGDKRIVLGRTEDGHVAFDDRCTHRGASLAGGAMICGTVQCPWHGTQFNVKTGEVKCGPATEKIPTYAISESDGKVFLNL
ncbi:MAG: hypothetical protein JWQ96_681 [Segetibacter sp.]|nr:hypothetical protein [Segetibacter sp.]